MRILKVFLVIIFSLAALAPFITERAAALGALSDQGHGQRKQAPSPPKNADQ